MTCMVFVTYPGGPSDRFDRGYWLDRHFSLVRDVWGPHGLQSVSGFFPGGDGGGIVAIAPTVFRDSASYEAAIAAPETERVMKDVKNFTDIEPVRLLGAPAE